MSWFYNSDSGSINQVPDIVAWPELHLGLGWHGPFATKDEAINYYNLGKAANPGWKAPTDLAGTITNTIPGASWLSSGTNIETLFIRVGEVLLGLVLIAVGVASLTGTSNVVSRAVRSKI